MMGRRGVDRTAIARDIASGAVGRRLVDVAGLLLRLAGPAGKEAREKPGNDLSQGGADAVGDARLAAVLGLRRLRRGTPPDPQPTCHDEHNHGSPRRRTLDHGIPPPVGGSIRPLRWQAYGRHRAGIPGPAKILVRRGQTGLACPNDWPADTMVAIVPRGT